MSRTSAVHLRRDLDSNFSFRVDNDSHLLEAEEANTVADMVSKEDWHKVRTVKWYSRLN